MAEKLVRKRMSKTVSGLMNERAETVLTGGNEMMKKMAIGISQPAGRLY